LIITPHSKGMREELADYGDIVDNAFNVCNDRINNGREVLRFILHFFQELAALQKSHADKVAKLCRSSSATFEAELFEKLMLYKNAQELGSMHSAWESVKEEVEKFSSAHASVSDSMQQHVVQPLRDMLEEYNARRKVVSTNAKACNTIWTQQHGKMEGIKTQYHKACQEYTVATDRLATASISDRVEKLEQSVAKWRMEVLDSRGRYLSVLEETQRMHGGHFKKELPRVLNDMQKLDLDRIDCIKKSLDAFVVTMAPIPSMYSASIAKMQLDIGDIDGIHDVFLFVQSHEDKCHIPPPPQMEDPPMSRGLAELLQQLQTPTPVSAPASDRDRDRELLPTANAIPAASVPVNDVTDVVSVEERRREEEEQQEQEQRQPQEVAEAPVRRKPRPRKKVVETTSEAISVETEKEKAKPKEREKEKEKEKEKTVQAVPVVEENGNTAWTRAPAEKQPKPKMPARQESTASNSDSGDLDTAQQMKKLLVSLKKQSEENDFVKLFNFAENELSLDDDFEDQQPLFAKKRKEITQSLHPDKYTGQEQIDASARLALVNSVYKNVFSKKSTFQVYTRIAAFRQFYATFPSRSLSELEAAHRNFLAVKNSLRKQSMPMQLLEEVSLVLRIIETLILEQS
jgi:hypothetical protein